MPRNEVLRQALLTAGITTADLAAACAVDAKTVERWVSRGRMPHPRHRVKAAEVLREDISVLWPGVVRRAVKVGADRELVAVYPRRADLPRALFRELIEATPLTVSMRVALTLAEIGKAPVPLDIRLSDRHIAMSVWVFDDEAIVSTHIGDGLGQDSVTIHLRRHQEGGAFDQYANHFETLWGHARPMGGAPGEARE